MTITITIRLDDHAEAYRAAAELTRLYGSDAINVWHEDDLDDTAEDISLITHVRQIIEDARNEEEAIARLRALQSAQGASNQHMRWLDDLIALHAPSGSDEAPPHGIARPEVHALLPRPNATRKVTGNTRQREAALRLVRDSVACPTCHARAGGWCHGPNWGSDATHTYGTQHVHQARIDLLRWES